MKIKKKIHHPHFESLSTSSSSPPLIFPSEPIDGGLDNINGDLIIYKNEIIIDPSGNRFTIIDKLGSGQFGQVYHCVLHPNSKIQKELHFAMKISKSTPDAHCIFNYEIQALYYLKSNLTDESKVHISIIETAFFYENHAIIILELLGPSLFEELKNRNFKGLPLKYIQKVFQSVLPVLNTLSSLQLIHCDVKPENILVLCNNDASIGQGDSNSSGSFGKKSANSGQNNVDISRRAKSSALSISLDEDNLEANIDDQEFENNPVPFGKKVGSYSHIINLNSNNQKNTNQNSNLDNLNFKLIDFGSCLFAGDNQDYLQSRYYRAPEVLLRLPYDSKIDIWSLGCLGVELMLGVPILPAQSELHLATLIEKTIGPFPRSMYENSPRSTQIFMPDGKVKPASLLCEENDEDFATTFKPYFIKKKLKKIMMSYDSMEPGNDLQDREIFVDLIQKMLAIDPDERISAEESLKHPFLSMDFRS